jgi:hypothetical protein
MGKFSKSGKFKLGVTALDWLAKYAKYKVRTACSGHDGRMCRCWSRPSGGGKNLSLCLPLTASQQQRHCSDSYVLRNDS